MSKIKMKKKTKNILLTILSCVLIFGVLFGIMALFNEEDKTTKEISPSYAVGSLNANGGYLESKESIYTKDAFKCNGLKITPDFKSTIKYQVYFYDFDGVFVNSTNLLTGKYDAETPLNASECRIVITPNDDTNIKWYEINGYAKQIKIEVADNQFDSLEKKITASENLCVMLGKGQFNTETSVFTNDNTSPFYFASPIDVNEIDTIVCKFDTSSLTGKVSYGGSELDKILIYRDGDGSAIVGTNLVVVDDCTYVSYNVSSYDSIVVAVDGASSTILEIYAI